MSSIENTSNDLKDDSPIRAAATTKTLEDRINEARKRAENFSFTLSEARKKESFHLKTIDEDRMKWANAYAAKVVELEQVERELAHAIVAIKAQEIESSQNNVTITEYSSSHQDSDQNLRESYQHLLQENNKLQVELAVIKSKLEVTSKQLEVYQYKIENLNTSNSSLTTTLRDRESSLDVRLSQVSPINVMNTAYSI